MMPGDNQSKMVAIAADATVGNCQNCSVLHQSLDEYVSSFLALKQKITTSDDTIRLHHHTKELQIRLVSLEKKTADYESLQKELEEKKDALETSKQMSEEIVKLKEENTKTSIGNQKLEDELKTLKELVETQALENAQLKREKAEVENDLLKTHTSLKKSQEQADQVEKLMKENTETAAMNKKIEDELKTAKELIEVASLENAQLTREKAAVENDLLKTHASLKESQEQAEQVEKLLKENAETAAMKSVLNNKVRLLEESVCKQNHEITVLTKEKFLLERNIDDLQVRLMKLERERNKEFRSTSTQACAPEEPKVDKEKVLQLLQDLWGCMEPQQQKPWNMYSTETTSVQSLLSSPENKPHRCQSNTSQTISFMVRNSQNHPTQGIHSCTSTKRKHPFRQDGQHQEFQQYAKGKVQTDGVKSHKQELWMQNAGGSAHGSEKTIEEILAAFKPMLPCLSPLPDMEMENGEANSNSKPADQVSNPCPGSSALQTEKTMDIAVVPTQEVEHKRQSIHIDGEHHQTEGRETVGPVVASSSFPSGIAVPIQVASLPTENQDPCSSENLKTSTKTSSEMPPCNTEDSGKVSSKSKNIAKMDVDVDAEDVTDAPVEESLREDEASAVSGETSSRQPDTCPTCTGSIQDGEDTNDEMAAATDSNVVLGCQNVTVLKSQMNTECHSEDTGWPQDNVCLSEAAVSNSIPSVANQKPEEGGRHNSSVKHFGKENENEHKGTGKTDVTTSQSESKDINKPPSPCKSLLLKMESAGEASVDQESDSAKVVDRETLKGGHVFNRLLLSDAQMKKTVNCKALEETPPSLCRQSSPLCLLPIINLQALERNTKPEKENVDFECLSANKAISHFVLNEGEGVVKSKCLSQESKSNVEPSVSHSTPVNQSDKCFAPVTEVCTKQSPNIVREGVSPGCFMAFTSAKTTAQQSESIGEVRSKMGPPLPPLLTPLTSPPKSGKHINPRQAIEKLSFPSPMEGSVSPTTPVLTPSSHQVSSSSLYSPLPPNGVPSSPLQFGSATPKHAVPVPGRLPLTARKSSSSSSCSNSPSQENSMRILDTMYPELSARARTLSILRGNVNLSICSSESGTLPTAAENQMSGFKSINSASTAFTKTEARGEKRHAASFPQPKSSKCLRLDNQSPSETPKRLPSSSSDIEDEMMVSWVHKETTSLSLESANPAESKNITMSLQKIESGCFDLMPVIQSHLYVGNLPKKPVLRDEEKDIISQICQNGSPVAEEMILAILKKLKVEKRALSRNYMEALCRVYTAICRQRGEWEKAHVLAYSILSEDFPDLARMILFMVTTWPSVLSHTGLLCQAIHTVTRLKTPKELLICMSAYLGWDKSPPCDTDELISRTISELQSGSGLSFTECSRYGYDLSAEAWEHVFTLHLLCSYKQWKWTYENILGKELWPLMNAWVTQPRDRQSPVSDVTVATVLRLIGHLTLLGIKDRCVSSVMTVANVINMFGRHGPAEGVPWEVQLAAVYCICDISPHNPKQALEALAEWREQTSRSVPPAITSYINQLGCICRQVKSGHRPRCNTSVLPV